LDRLGSGVVLKNKAAAQKRKEIPPSSCAALSNLDSTAFEEGRPRRSNGGTLPQEIGAAGREAQARQRAAVREVKPLLQHVSDLPRHADFKVALHLLERRGAPSSKEGIGASRYQSGPEVGQQSLPRKRLRSRKISAPTQDMNGERGRDERIIFLHHLVLISETSIRSLWWKRDRQSERSF